MAAVTVSSDRGNAEKVLHGVEEEAAGCWVRPWSKPTVEWME